MMTGEIPNHLVEAVFELVKNNKNLLEHVAPHLNLHADVTNYDLDATKRVHRSKCYVLSPELQQYYDQIRQFNSMKNYVEMEGVNVLRRSERNADDTRQKQRKRVVRSCSKGEVHEKFVIVERLLRQFDRLSLPNQKRAYDARTNLLTHLHMLDELRRFANASERDGKLRLIRSSAGDKRMAADEDALSERYSKLAKAAEFIRKSSFFDQSDEISDYDDYRAFNEYGYGE